jgi:hypothetical protein
MTHADPSGFYVETAITSTGAAAVWVVLDGVAFPEAGWTDFPMVILPWWTDAAIKLLRGAAGPVEMRFMDGPYWVELCANGADNVRFRRQARSGPQTQHAGTADVLQVASALAKALAGVLADAGSRGDGSAAPADLVAAHARLVNALGMARKRAIQ